ncbi:MAG: heavy metal translocating P-type ATPase [Odoribacteraceae bacterium]|jgi:Cd2+/Zn2+-exporting ATPase|nr:heavy metal translocating P-type ATPase [Odoribacteraceae bacterium]
MKRDKTNRDKNANNRQSTCCCGRDAGQRSSIPRYLPAIISLILLAGGIAADQFRAFPLAVRLPWYLLAYLPVGWPVLRSAALAIRRGDVFNEFTLMSLATAGAFLIEEYPEGVAVMLFYSVGELFQEAAVGKARRNISALVDARPTAATVIREGVPRSVDPSEVSVGETIEVKAGERAPLDGALQEAPAAFDTSALTGESLPREIAPGEEVLAGMIAIDRVIRLVVTRPFEQSAFARVLRLVQEAAERKAPTERFIHAFARVYTPIVVGLAVLLVVLAWVYTLVDPSVAYDFTKWFRRALTFLVISCPCALVISIPLGYFGGIGAASRRGILFKGGNYLDAITRVNTVALDKTGTLTRGNFEVQHLDATLPEREFIGILHAVESTSTHPIARAISRYAAGVPPLSSPSRSREIAGRGIEATLDAREILLGNARMFDEASVPFPADLRDIPGTVVLCAVDRRYVGHVIVADALKEDAVQAVAALRRAGVHRVIILSGDATPIVQRVAAQTGVNEALGDLLPEDKVAYLQQLKSNPANRVAFVGDGINDAPVLAASDVGIAMGALGSDIAIETADVVIQTDQPSKIAEAIYLGRRTRRVVIQNISLAFGVKLLVLLLAVFNTATLWQAVLADVGVALLAILNASRVLVAKKVPRARQSMKT